MMICFVIQWIGSWICCTSTTLKVSVAGVQETMAKWFGADVWTAIIILVGIQCCTLEGLFLVLVIWLLQGKAAHVGIVLDKESY